MKSHGRLWCRLLRSMPRMLSFIFSDYVKVKKPKESLLIGAGGSWEHFHFLTWVIAHFIFFVTHFNWFFFLVRVMDCYFHEGIKVLYRVTLAILILFHKHTQNSSEWSSDSIKNDIDNAIPKFCKQIPVSPIKLMRTAFNIRALR